MNFMAPAGLDQNVLNFHFFQLLRRYRMEYHHEPLEYAVTFMYAPDGPLRLRMIER